MSDKLPAVTSQVPRDLRNFLDRVRDILKTTGAEAFLTAKQLAQLNLARIDAQGNLRPVTDAGGFLPTPPAPQNVVANAAIQNIIVEWDRPNYRGHAYAEVWGAGVDDFTQAALIGSAPGGIYVDSVGPSITRYYWIRFVNEEDTRGPFNSISGTDAATGPDVDYILGLLAGRITESELFSALAERIELIDGAASIPGSVNARLAVVQGQVNDLLNIPAWDETITYAQGEQVSFAGGLYIALQGSTNVSPNDTDFWQRIGDYTTLGDAVAAQAIQIAALDDGLGAAVTQTNALATQLRGTYDGTDLSLVTSGLIFQERQARNTADSALASDITTLTAFANTRSRIFYQNTPPAASGLIVGDTWVNTTPSYSPDYLSQDYSVGGNRIHRWTGSAWVEAPDSDFADSFAAIQLERVARADGDSALASQILTLEANVNSNTAAIQQEVTARADADSALATQIDTLRAEVNTDIGTVIAAVQSEAAARADADAALASNITTVIANYTAADAATLSSAQDYADNVGATVLSTTTASIQNEATTRADADTALAASITTVIANYTAADAATLSSAQDYADNVADTVLVTTTAAVQNEATARATADSALAASITTVQASVEANTASIQTEAATRATADGELFAQYTVKIDTNGYVSGFGLASTLNNALPFSTFVIRADSFVVASPSGPGLTPIFPFTVNTVTQTINGVSVPPGVYMDAAFIKNGTITNAKIGDAAIDNAKIANLSADKINAGFLSADRIQTGTLDAKIANINAAVITSGFINNARIQDASISAAKIQDATITTAKIADVLQSTNYAAGSAGWRINKAGDMEINSATFRGTIDVSSSTTGARLEIKNNVIKVFDESGVLRVKIGDLAA